MMMMIMMMMIFTKMMMAIGENHNRTGNGMKIYSCCGATNMSPANMMTFVMMTIDVKHNHKDNDDIYEDMCL